MPDLSLDDAKRGVILFPTRISFPEHPARTAEVLELARHVGLHSIYLLLETPHGKKTITIWNLKGICVRLNAPFTVVSSKKSLLVYVSLSNPTIRLERPPLEGG